MTQEDKPSTSPTSSSNREGGVCDAVVLKDQHPVGPMRLPLSRAEDFIDQFNRLYAGLGITLLPVSDDSKESDVPASGETTTEARKSS